MRERGMRFVGLDVIGDWLTEVNVTSPTFIRELDAQFGLNIAGMLFDAIEAGPPAPPCARRALSCSGRNASLATDQHRSPRMAQRRWPPPRWATDVLCCIRVPTYLSLA